MILKRAYPIPYANVQPSSSSENSIVAHPHVLPTFVNSIVHRVYFRNINSCAVSIMRVNGTVNTPFTALLAALEEA